MTFTFESPLVLFATAPAVVWAVWLSRRSYAQLAPGARRVALALRALILVLLVGALARPVWSRLSGGRHVVFLVDVSGSITDENAKKATEWVDAAARQATEGGDRVSVVAFGQEARPIASSLSAWRGWTESQLDLLMHRAVLRDLGELRVRLLTQGADRERLQSLQSRVDAVGAFVSEIVGDRTDPLNAVRLALNVGSAGDARGIVMLTDANVEPERLSDAFAEASSGGCDVQTVALDVPGPPEVAAVDLVVPARVRINQAFSAELHVASSVATGARIAMFRDGVSSGEFGTALRAGDNIIRLPTQFFREKGFHIVSAAIRPESDTRLENNTVQATVVVPGGLRVLVVDPDESQQTYFTSALALEGIEVQSRPASGAPRSMEELLGFDAIVLSNLPADRLTSRQMQMLRTYVRDFGGGLIMLGGDQSFGLGGYYNTPVEEILPVRMPIQKDLTRPSIAIALVIDKSGSMEGTKMQLAKRAAIATAEVINPRDQITVAAFDGEARLVVPLTTAGDRAGVAQGVASLEAGGGTFLQPGLEIALEQLRQTNARKKHVIILSDGQTQGFGYAETAQAMAGEGITVSTVGIGDGADQRLLEEIASAGGGRAYFTSDFATIPQIFTREALRASNSMLVERLVTAVLQDDDECVAEIDTDDLPSLSGYVATTAKPAAKVVLACDSGDPLLARWRYGLGHAAAFTSDVKPRWAEEWIRWPDFAKFWSQVVRSICGPESARGVSLEFSRDQRDGAVRLFAEMRDASGHPVNDRPLQLAMIDAESGRTSIPVELDAPGTFVANIPRPKYGTPQQFTWTVGGPDEEPVVMPFGYIESFSPEFRTLGVSTRVLDQIRQRENAKVYSVGDSPAKATFAPGSSVERVPAWPILLVVSILLCPLDILARRLG